MGILPVPVVLGQTKSSIYKSKPCGCAIASRAGLGLKLYLAAYTKIFRLGEAFKI
jgi:hypothetical protein